ncbi:hypothetical protein ACFQU7_26095 [Pseudoroseomonas wenyumeiae]
MRKGLTLAMAGVALLAGCASPPPPPTVPSGSNLPATQSAALVRAALTEWERWGRLTVDGWPEALPAAAAPENYSNVLTYWEAVPEGPASSAATRTPMTRCWRG